MANLLQKLMFGSSTAALVAAMPVTSAMAQGGGDTIEQVVVSASRVTIAGYTQPTPVTVVGSAELEKSAFSNIQDAVRELPQVQSPPSTASATTGGGTPGTAGENLLNLRGLGVSRTLVLLDSQRVVASNISGGVDVSTLPSALVQRVDVVTGGASASWGSDAVSGVVNFVLNKNFDGFKANFQAGDTYNGLDRSLTAQVDWGGDIFGGRGHLIAALNANILPDTVPLMTENWWTGAYWVSNPAYTAGSSLPQLIVANDVGMLVTSGGLIVSSPAVTAANSPSGAAVAANVLRGIQFVGNGIPQIANFGNVTLGALSNGGSLTAHDGDAIQELGAIPTKQYNGFFYGRYKLTDSIQASLQLNMGYATTKSRSTGAFQTALIIKSDNAFIPASVKATIQATGITSFTMGEFSADNFDQYNIKGSTYFPNAEGQLGPAAITNQRMLQRGVMTLEGTLGEDWAWNTYAQHSVSNIAIHTFTIAVLANLAASQDAVTVTTANRGTSGLPLGSIVCRSSLPGQAAVVLSGVTAQSGCIPLNSFGLGVASPSAIRYITDSNSDFQDMHLEQDVMEASMQGTLPWELPAGKVAIAFGAGYRKESAHVRSTAIGGAGGYGVANYANFPAASYNVAEGFGEIDAPIIKNGFVNSLDVSAAGRITSYSTSGMVETWKLGATSQINDDIKLRATWSVDIRAPGLNELFTPDQFTGGSFQDPKTNKTVAIFTQTLGNPVLNPEVARTISGGIVLTPTFIEGLTFSADWFSINLTGQIGSVSAATILNQCNPSKDSTIYPGTKGNPNDPLCTLLEFKGPNDTAGPALSSIFLIPINFSSQTTSGMDLAANYTMDFWDGTLVWNTVASLKDESTTTQPGVGVNDSAGTGGNPKWKGVVSASYTSGPFSFTTQGRWYGTNKYSNTANTGNLATPSTANLYDPAHFHLPFVAYLDFRSSYKWNDNIQIYGAIDNFTNVPPPLLPPLSSAIKANGSTIPVALGTYDVLGRAFRVGVRLSY